MKNLSVIFKTHLLLKGHFCLSLLNKMLNTLKLKGVT